MTRFLIVGLGLLSCCVLSFAQHERYELGLRLRQFEKAWDECKDPAGRTRALKIVKDATNQFFSLKFGEAGKTLDSARWALTHETARTDNEVWFESYMMKPTVRVVDGSTNHIKVEIDQFYKSKPNPNPFQGASISISLSEAGRHSQSLFKKPESFTVKFDEDSKNELAITMQFRVDEQVHVNSAITISRIENLTKRLTALKSDHAMLPTSAGKSVSMIAELITELKDGIPPETDFPVSAMLAHAELMQKERKLLPSAAVPGQEMTSSWFTLALEKKTLAPIRLGVPAKWNKDKPTPIVFALHGAGGSENMFFDSYGDGRVVKECAKRGWLLVAPRSPGFVASPQIKEILAELKTFLKVDDSKVFILGHSMGAGQTMDIIQRDPSLFAGAAIMGGSGRLRDAKIFDTLPLFIGIGDQDFAYGGAKTLNQSLTKATAKKVTFKTYPNFEHLVIVREALPDVFAMFDEIAGKK